jgi:TatD DNase family protein
MLIDAHSHVDRYDLLGAGALASALGEMTQHRILTISNSMDLQSYRRNLEISEMCSLVLPAFGMHPWNAVEYVDRLGDLGEAIEQSPIIGEIGLDHHLVEDASAYPAQWEVLRFFLAEAKEQDKITTLHTKGAEREVLQLLDQYQIPRVIVHWYSGPMDVFREMAARGVYFTVGVEVLYSEHVRAIAREVPSGRLLTETDNPGGPIGFIGEPGMPVLVQEVVRGLAEAREAAAEAIIQTVQTNLLGLIRHDPRLSAACALLEECETGAQPAHAADPLSSLY